MAPKRKISAKKQQPITQHALPLIKKPMEQIGCFLYSIEERFTFSPGTAPRVGRVGECVCAPLRMLP